MKWLDYQYSAVKYTTCFIYIYHRLTTGSYRAVDGINLCAFNQPRCFGAWNIYHYYMDCMSLSYPTKETKEADKTKSDVWLYSNGIVIHCHKSVRSSLQNSPDRKCANK